MHFSQPRRQRILPNEESPWRPHRKEAPFPPRQDRPIAQRQEESAAQDARAEASHLREDSEQRHYLRGPLSTVASPLVFADGLLVLSFCALALGAAVFLSAQLAMAAIFSIPATQQPLPLLALALVGGGGACGALVLLRHSVGQRFRPGLTTTAIICCLGPGAFLLVTGLPAYPAISRALPLVCLALALACVVKLILELWCFRRSEILSPVDPGFRDQLEELQTAGGRFFAVIAAAIVLLTLVAWRLIS